MMIERVMLIPKMFFFQGNHFSQPFSEPAGGGGKSPFILFSSEE